MSVEQDRVWSALWSVISMVIGAIVIVFIVFGFRHCEAQDDRIRECLSNGHHTAVECRCAIAGYACADIR